MHDIKWIRENPAAFDNALSKRGLEAPSVSVLNADDKRKKAVFELQRNQEELNKISQEIQNILHPNKLLSPIDLAAAYLSGDPKEAEQELKKNKISKLQAAAKEIKLSQKNFEERATDANGYLYEELLLIPNMLDNDVPDGRNEEDNKQIKVNGIHKNVPFAAKQHFEIGEALGLMDFAAAGKISGSRFTVLRGALARLERALGQFMLDVHTQEHGYSETSVPLLVNEAAVFGTGQLPKFAEDLFKTTDGRWLIPTAEVSLTNLVGAEILPVAQLPIRVTALTPCFRSEAGSAGRDVRGMLRQHQFSKVEMVSITHPDASTDEHEQMTRNAEVILERLELPYRRMLLCAGDTGFSAAKTYDLEVWLPGQGMYREISSCSNTRAFQARRMNARYREADGKTLGFVHTLNGSGVAVGRALIAVLENYQNEDGSVTVPEVLKPYMGGVEIIKSV